MCMLDYYVAMLSVRSATFGFNTKLRNFSDISSFTTVALTRQGGTLWIKCKYMADVVRVVL